LPGLYKAHHHRRAFSDQHCVTELLGLVLEFGDIASSAAAADKPDIVEMTLAFGGVFQALGQEEQSFVVGNRRYGRSPGGVMDKYRQEVAMLWFLLYARQQFVRVAAKLIKRQWGDKLPLGGEDIGGLTQHVAYRPARRDAASGGAGPVAPHRYVIRIMHG
jgi:hypothetical protein